jgi:hypothetical protein
MNARRVLPQIGEFLPSISGKQPALFILNAWPELVIRESLSALPHYSYRVMAGDG